MTLLAKHTRPSFTFASLSPPHQRITLPAGDSNYLGDLQSTVSSGPLLSLQIRGTDSTSLFSMADDQVSMVDGLTPMERQILFCALDRPLSELESSPLLDFADYVDGWSCCEYDRKVLVKAVIKMGLNSDGINNISLLSLGSFFGTRRKGGKDRARARYLETNLSTVTRHLFRKEDEGLLKHKEDKYGESVEQFLPIIPMVLVNGSEERRFPKYNPRDIIANLRRLLIDKCLLPMDPWYKGFKGKIEKTASGGYLTKGVVEEKQGEENALIITQLPVGLSTQEYDKFLEGASQSFIKGYKLIVDHDLDAVHFEVTMTGDQMEKARKEGFLDKFNLITTLSTDDMHLLDANGVSKKYDTPEQIVADFFSVRLGYYEKRNAVEVEGLEEACWMLEMKAKFLEEALTGSLVKVLRDKDEAEVCEWLKEKGFKPKPNASNPIEGFQYLLSTPIYGAGLTTLDDWKKQVVDMKDKIQRLKDMQSPPKSLWLRELCALDKALDDVERYERWNPTAGIRITEPWEQIIDDGTFSDPDNLWDSRSNDDMDYASDDEEVETALPQYVLLAASCVRENPHLFPQRC